MTGNPSASSGLREGGKLLASQEQDFDSDGLESCLSKAGSLLELLKEEAEALRRFKGDALLSILPSKERLSVELRQSVLLLKKREKESGIDQSASKDYISLKRSLMEIARLNEANRIFIDGSLSYYNDLLKCYGSSAYGPGMGEAAKRKALNYKGMVFRKEA